MEPVNPAGICLLLLSMAGYFFALRGLWRIRFWFMPLFCAAGISLFLFIGALAGELILFANLSLSAGLAGFSCFLARACRKKLSFPGWTLERVCIGTGILVFLFLSLCLKLTHYDNFSHWALMVKYLLGAGKLPGADTVLIPFRDYPPGISLFLFYICRYAGHAQGILLLAQNSVLLACFLAIFGIVRERRRFLLYSFLAMGCSMLSYLNLTVRINNLLVDFLLPLLALGSVSYSLGEQKDSRLLAGQILLLGFTGIVKSTGLFFAGTAGLYALGRWIRKGRKEKRGVFKGILGALLLAAGAAAPFLLWQEHLRTDLAGFQGKFQISGISGVGESAPPDPWEAESSGEPAGKELRPRILEKFLKTALNPSDRAFQALVFCVFFTGALSIYVRLERKPSWKPWRILAPVLLLTLVYYGGLLYLYLYFMPEEEALRLAGFERYACSGVTLSAGLLLLWAEGRLEGSFSVGIDERGAYRAYSSPAAKRRYQYAVLGTFLLAVNFLYSEIGGLLAIREEYEASLPARAEALVGDRWYPGGEADKKRYLIIASDEEGQVSSGEVRYVFRYFLWSPYVEAAAGLTDRELEEVGKEYDCVIRLP